MTISQLLHFRGKPALLILTLLCFTAISGCSSSGSGQSPNSSARMSGSDGKFGNKDVPAICGEPSTDKRTSLSDKKDRGDIHLQLGMGYLQQGKYETALSQLKKAVQLSPSSVDAHSAMALLNQRMKRTDEARKSYERALRIAPGNPDTNNNYGYFLCQQGEFLAADKRFQCALANPLYNTPWRAYYNAGICALKAGELKQADIYLRTTRQLAPNVQQTLYHLADLAYKRQSYLQAADYLKRYREAADPRPEDLWLGVLIARKLDDADMEASYLLSLKNLFPDSDQAQDLYTQ